MQETQRREFNPWAEKIPWRGNGNPLQRSCLENSMDRGACWATVYGVAKSQARLSTHIDTPLIIDFILHTHLSNNFILNSRFSFKDILEKQKKSFYVYLHDTVSGALHIFVQIQISIRYHFLSA